ncbi:MULTISPECIES: hypothetical protein [Clostridium]|uniref:Uncharacterized protein n=1 Tax=Clostridium cadaveris TaxID=1529 RepID=A0A1I2KNU2_9CLOT|nr:MULTISPECIES: hypothetical protein [Clostridium]MDU4953005.1 hypothetical protein [Clostridium sp.]MDM8312321.1 hypothetical protein [Clostridium cadaveris]MDY4604002.1 hypothetical protein [Clostridium tertium]MDY4949990.1 hypothetical protein [Clostridium cadaveris]NME64571.1 hypothetical protein [Clostridium cadaveris]
MGNEKLMAYASKILLMLALITLVVGEVSYYYFREYVMTFEIVFLIFLFVQYSIVKILNKRNVKFNNDITSNIKKMNKIIKAMVIGVIVISLILIVMQIL